MVKAKKAAVAVEPELTDVQVKELLALPAKKSKKRVVPQAQTVVAEKPSAKKTLPKKQEATVLPPNKPQIRILEALLKHGPLTRAALAQAANVDPSMIGDYAGFKNQEINERPKHANLLVNRGYVTMRIDDVDGKDVLVYTITASGKKAL